MKLSTTVFATLLIAFGSVASGKEALLRGNGRKAEENSERKLKASILELASTTDELSTLTDFLLAAGFGDEFPEDGTFTVFAPDNDAFNDVPPATLSSLQADAAALEDVLDYHIVPGAVVRSCDLRDGLTAATAEGRDVTVTSVTPPMINDATVIKADIEASNGVIHIIDKVLIPPPEMESVESEEDASP